MFTNQIREKVGVMFGSPETQPGGRALKFYASQRLDIRRIETLKDGTEAVGNRVRVKVVKNKVAAPFKQAEFDIEFGKGISTSGCLLDYGIEHNIVTKSGSFFSYGDERLGQGRGNAKAFLDEHQEMAKEIEAKVYAALGHQPRPRQADRARRDGGAPLAVEAEPADRETRRVARLDADGRSGAHARAERPAIGARACVRYLNRRERTVAEVRRAPRAQGRRCRATIERPIADADRAGLARRRALRAAVRRRTSASSSDWGAERISARPARPAGSTRELVERTLAEHERRRRRASSTRALELLRRRFPTPPRERRERDRALGVLLRKGYDSELALDALAAHARAADSSSRHRRSTPSARARWRPAAPFGAVVRRLRRRPPVLRSGQRTNGPRATKNQQIPINLGFRTQR